VISLVYVFHPRFALSNGTNEAFICGKFEKKSVGTPQEPTGGVWSSEPAGSCSIKIKMGAHKGLIVIRVKIADMP
jgi:hypothetical protein